MGFLVFYLVILSCLIVLVARFLAGVAYHWSVRKGHPRPKLIQMISFLISFAVIFAAVFLMIIHRFKSPH